MYKLLASLLLAATALPASASAADRFALADVRLGSGPFLDAQNRNLHYLMSLDPDRVLAPFQSTGDVMVKARLDYFVNELKKCQQANGNGYIGGIPEGSKAWQDIAKGAIKADNFTVNGKWVSWYNLHKAHAGLRDAYRYGANQDARAMLVGLADWALKLRPR